jgi:sulfate permease, SulP family
MDWSKQIRADFVGGLVSAAVAIPLAMGYGMFAFASLGERYFADGALAGLTTAFVVAVVCVVLGDRTTTVYAPRVTAPFFSACSSTALPIPMHRRLPPAVCR